MRWRTATSSASISDRVRSATPDGPAELEGGPRGHQAPQAPHPLTSPSSVPAPTNHQTGPPPKTDPKGPPPRAGGGQRGEAVMNKQLKVVYGPRQAPPMLVPPPSLLLAAMPRGQLRTLRSPTGAHTTQPLAPDWLGPGSPQHNSSAVDRALVPSSGSQPPVVSFASRGAQLSARLSTSTQLSHIRSFHEGAAQLRPHVLIPRLDLKTH